MLVNQQTLAEIFKVDRTTINRWKRAGLPVDGRKYDIEKAVQWRLQNQQTTEDESRAEAERRKAIADADMKELDLEESRKLLVLAEDVEKMLSDKISTARNSLMTVKSTLMPALRAHAGDNAQLLQQMIGDEIERILDEMASA